jgi:hypothetical protein
MKESFIIREQPADAAMLTATNMQTTDHSPEDGLVLSDHEDTPSCKASMKIDNTGKTA